MKAVIWGYKFKDMQESWCRQVLWMVNSLQKYGVIVRPHANFICKDLALPLYNHTRDHDADICIYNHTDESAIIGNVLKVKRNWFFKPTVPDEKHTTLDELGYGPYSSITYKKPDFENEGVRDVKKFFNTQVRDWVETRVTKWGARFRNETQEVEERDYHLVLGQCGGDEVVNKHDFGHYFMKMEQVVRELVRVDGQRWIVVKLHPYTDGTDATSTSFSENQKDRLKVISPIVKVYAGKTNIHNFLKHAHCVHLANSGAGFEAMMHHKPIIAWGFPEYHWVAYDLRHLAEMKNAIELRWFDPKRQDKFLYWYMEKYCFYNQETSDRRVGELLGK